MHTRADWLRGFRERNHSFTRSVSETELFDTAQGWDVLVFFHLNKTQHERIAVPIYIFLK